MHGYLFSTERYVDGLPAAGTILRSARCVERSDAVFFKLDQSLQKGFPRILLLVPKALGEEFFEENSDHTFAYVLDGTRLIEHEPISLGSLKRKVLDWGGMAKTLETAMKWQVSPENQAASDEVMKILERQKP